MHTVVFQRDGIAYLDGMVVFTDGALKGEKAEIEIISVGKSYAKAKIAGLLSASDERISPACEAFGVCGGCSLLHRSYEGQLKAKNDRVLQTVARIGKISGFESLPISPSPSIYNYRNKTEFRFKGGKCGFFAGSSHDFVPVGGCRLASAAALKAASAFSAASEKAGFVSSGVLTVRNDRSGEYGVIIDADGQSDAAKKTAEYIFQDEKCRGVLLRHGGGKTLYGEPGIYETLLGKRFFISHEAFFQVNTEQAERMLSTVAEFLSADENTVLLDAYCGVGTIGIAAASNAKMTVGIETNENAVKDAAANAELNGVSNAVYLAGRCEEKYSECGKYGVNAVVCDPPRAGCGREFIGFLKRLMPEKIIYVSCDPATLARDLGLLSDRFTVDKLQPFDMFPQTDHVETVALITQAMI